jgi:hypothetical protein
VRFQVLSIRSEKAKKRESTMFIVYMVLFLGGFYLFGAAFNVEGWEGLIFTAGILSVSLALGLVFHGHRKA